MISLRSIVSISTKCERNYSSCLRTYVSSNPETEPRREHREGPIARSIEQQTAKVPSDVFLWAALGSIAASLAFKFSRKDHAAYYSLANGHRRS